jgi:hypothetical protein
MERFFMEEPTMADIVSDLAAKSGINVDQAKQGLGALLNLLRDKIPADTFSKVQAAIPGSANLMEHAESSSGGGVLGAVKEAAGKLFGGGGSATAALATLQETGMSAEQGQNLFRNALEFLKDKLPEGIVKQIRDLIPPAG